MNDIRFEVKVKLREEDKNFFPECPLCPERGAAEPETASQMHEIISPKGWKSLPEEDPRYIAMHQPETCILLCPECNVNFANGYPKDKMLALKMGMPGYSPERVIPKVRDIASYLKYPREQVPQRVEFNGSTYPIL